MSPFVEAAPGLPRRLHPRPGPPRHGRRGPGGPTLRHHRSGQSGAVLAWEYFHPGRPVPCCSATSRTATCGAGSLSTAGRSTPRCPWSPATSRPGTAWHENSTGMPSAGRRNWYAWAQRTWRTGRSRPAGSATGRSGRRWPATGSRSSTRRASPRRSARSCAVSTPRPRSRRCSRWSRRPRRPGRYGRGEGSTWARWPGHSGAVGTELRPATGWCGGKARTRDARANSEEQATRHPATPKATADHACMTHAPACRNQPRMSWGVTSRNPSPMAS